MVSNSVDNLVRSNTAVDNFVHIVLVFGKNDFGFFATIKYDWGIKYNLKMANLLPNRSNKKALSKAVTCY